MSEVHQHYPAPGTTRPVVYRDRFGEWRTPKGAVCQECRATIRPANYPSDAFVVSGWTHEGIVVPQPA